MKTGYIFQNKKEKTMSIKVIGKQIASMRKERGIKQEELAAFVGVSPQAVSKWENGGVPDIEILPKIADFFGISIDCLFGRCITDYNNLQELICNKIISASNEDRFKLIFNYCWDMERALFGKIPQDGCIEDYEKEIAEHEQRYSSVITDYGFTRMGIANRLQYFLLVPEIKDTETAFFNGIDYLSFFKDFSDKDVFNACVMLNKREGHKAFTHNILVKNMGIKPDKAIQVLDILEKYNLLHQTQIEMDDEIQTVYNFNPTPSFIAFLIFAREVIKTPNSFTYYCIERNNPYIK